MAVKGQTHGHARCGTWHIIVFLQVFLMSGASSAPVKHGFEKLFKRQLCLSNEMLASCAAQFGAHFPGILILFLFIFFIFLFASSPRIF